MIEKIIEWCIRNRFLVLIVAAALAVWGVYAVLNTPMDAIPDLSENQVIVFTDWMGRSPQEIEDQITYPLSLKLQGLAGVRTVRSSSEFNFSMITIIFEDNVDFYFARQRVLEKLTLVVTFLPQGVTPYLAADATALGQVFWYTLEPNPSHPVDPGQLGAINRFVVAPELNSVPGVAEVGTAGVSPREYQIDVRPEALRAYGVTLGDLYAAVANSNLAVGGRVIQKNSAEYLVRGVGWIKNKNDIENTLIKESEGTPIYVKSVAEVQLGQQFRRSVFEKDGNEVAGGVVLMRYGGNPLDLTRRIKEKIQEIQPALPEGVRIVPAYDRTRLIHGAIHTLTEVMGHEMLIAGLAILLILFHFRSVFVICVTLPLSVLFAFWLMWLLRTLNILDIQANIMSLAGITISIGILVDQAIVMVENTTHHLKDHFGTAKVSGDTRDIVIRACRTVGRPIFFSVLIMLLSFIPVFMLTGQQGKYFRPLAFTKSFALLGTALISVTIVPALIPTFIRGRLRSEEGNPIVRSFIHIYKPMLTWALPRRNLVMWFFAVLLIIAAGLFPIQALFGQGASISSWRICYYIVAVVVGVVTVLFTRGLHWQLLSLATLTLLSFWAFNLPKIGVAYMPPLDEGSVMDMATSVPRVSLTQVADDIKHRDGLLRGFPEVESVIGKTGRADTPTDPAPLEMAETFVNFRPRELWPKRVLLFKDAERETRAVLRVLEERGFVGAAPGADERDGLVNEAAMKAVQGFDDVERELAQRRYQEFETELGPVLTRFAVVETVRRFRQAGDLHWVEGTKEEEQVEELTKNLVPELGSALARNPAQEDLTHLSWEVAKRLAATKALSEPAGALALKESEAVAFLHQAAEFLGAKSRTFAGELLQAVTEKRMTLWRKRVKQINWELFDAGTQTYIWLDLEELTRGARSLGMLDQAPHGAETARFIEAADRAQTGKKPSATAMESFVSLRDELVPLFRASVFLWPRQSGPRGDLVDDEMGRVLQVPGWGNLFTQPIINRIDMLSTGVRTDVGVKVFGPDPPTIEKASKDIEKALKPLETTAGARNVYAGQINNKGYLEIEPDRAKAERYGVSVTAILDTIEVALGGRHGHADGGGPLPLPGTDPLRPGQSRR